MLECLNPDCKKTFLHAAILTKVRMKTTENPTGTDTTLEVHVCPFCESPVIQEHKEKIVSVKSVDLGEVDEFLKQGYTVHELYARSATLTKKEVQ
jgi:hypothetical protein